MHRNKKLTEEEKDDLRMKKTVVNRVFVAIKKQLMIVQHEITEITGKPIQKQHLEVSHIDEESAEIEKIEAKEGFKNII